VYAYSMAIHSIYLEKLHDDVETARIFVKIQAADYIRMIQLLQYFYFVAEVIVFLWFIRLLVYDL
jgi:hypothetical protein